MNKYFAGAIISISAVGYVGFSATAANATVVDGAFSGFVVNGGNGIDEANLFGFGVGANLGGQTITGTFSYNSSGITANQTDGSSYNYTWAISPLVPPLSITETINGHSVVFSGNYESLVNINANTIFGPGGGTYTGIGVSAANTSGLWADLSATVYNSYSNSPAIASNINDIGSVDLNLANLRGQAVWSNGDINDPGFDQMEFTFTSFKAGPAAVSPVPLPGTLPMFGFGIIGLGVFARQRIVSRVG
jgi:hypothetical protein